MRIGLPLIIGLLCAGCQTIKGIDSATREPPDNPPPCKGLGGGNNQADCQILVKVIERDRECLIELADPNQSDVLFRLGERNLWIVWKLMPDSANYRFVDKTGIVFKADPLNNFDPRNAVANGERFAVKNKNHVLSGYGSYDYGIQVQRRDGSRRCELDPWVRNR